MKMQVVTFPVLNEYSYTVYLASQRQKNFKVKIATAVATACHSTKCVSGMMIMLFTLTMKFGNLKLTCILLCEWCG